MVMNNLKNPDFIKESATMIRNLVNVDEILPTCVEIAITNSGDVGGKYCEAHSAAMFLIELVNDDVQKLTNYILSLANNYANKPFNEDINTRKPYWKLFWSLFYLNGITIPEPSFDFFSDLIMKYDVNKMSHQEFVSEFFVAFAEYFKLSEHDSMNIGGLTRKDVEPLYSQYKDDIHELANIIIEKVWNISCFFNVRDAIEIFISPNAYDGPEKPIAIKPSSK